MINQSIAKADRGLEFYWEAVQMSMELQTHLSKQLAEAQTKYTYFLLAVAASAIALVVQRTTGRSLNLSMIPLGLAVLCWSVSFFSGCRNRAYFSSMLHTNVALLKVQNGTHPGVPFQPDAIAAASEDIKEAADYKSSKANFWGNLQFRLLVLGAISFLVWHIIEMMNVAPGVK